LVPHLPEADVEAKRFQTAKASRRERAVLAAAVVGGGDARARDQHATGRFGQQAAADGARASIRDTTERMFQRASRMSLCAASALETTRPGVTAWSSTCSP
jgi:hypothetical protein